LFGSTTIILLYSKSTNIFPLLSPGVLPAIIIKIVF
jgi:hypothetical protein